MNGANEAAVWKFLRGELGYPELFERVALATESVPYIENPTLDEILETDREARLVAEGRLAN